MRDCNYFLLFTLYLFTLPIQAQHSGKDSCSKEVFINELYFYNEATDRIKYKNRREVIEWIEIGNFSSEKVPVKEFYFTSDTSDLHKYRITARRRKYSTIKKGRVLAVYLNRGRRRAKTYYRPEGNYLYLVRDHQGSISIVDTVVIKEEMRYPYSRYPDGKEFKTLDALTPGFKNAYYHESESWKTKGVTFQGGASTSKAAEFQNTTRFTPSFALGLYSRRNIYSRSIEKGFRFALRGYGISYNETVSTSKGIREINTRGRQSLIEWDHFYNQSHRLTNKFSVYYGGIFSIRIAGRLRYRQQTTFTYFNNGSQVKTDQRYVFNNHNAALNVIDLYFTVGFRYHFKEDLNLSVCYIRSVLALSSSGHQTNSGIYFSTEIPLMKTLARIKRSTIF